MVRSILTEGSERWINCFASGERGDDVRLLSVFC
jgi:hypothetical protein